MNMQTHLSGEEEKPGGPISSPSNGKDDLFLPREHKRLVRGKRADRAGSSLRAGIYFSFLV